MLALMKPSNVATRSKIRGTSRGCTVVTSTSGAAGPACGALREQPANETKISSAPDAALVKNRFTWSRIVSLGFNEGEQIFVDRLRLGTRHAVWKTFVSLERAVLQQLCRKRRGIGIWHNLIVVAVHHQNWYVNFLQIFSEVGLRKRDDAVIVGLGSAHHSLSPPIPDDTFGTFRAGPVKTVERSGWHIIIELGAVSGDLLLKIIEHFFGKTAGIFLSLQHQRRHRAEDRCLRQPTFAVARDVVHDFATTGRMADMHRVLQIEMLG